MRAGRSRSRHTRTMSELCIGAFGGTFDPVHNGHVKIASVVIRRFRLDKLLIIPAHRPPHKRDRAIAGGFDRYAMVALATLDEPRVVASTIELEAPDRPYTFETIERLRSAFGPASRFFFVIGADSFEEINTWRNPDHLLSSTNLIVVTRPGHDVAGRHLEERFRATIVDLREDEAEVQMPEDSSEHHIYLIAEVNDSVSSTEVRRRVRDGESIAGMVSPRVADYIEKYELYR